MSCSNDTAQDEDRSRSAPATSSLGIVQYEPATTRDENTSMTDLSNSGFTHNNEKQTAAVLPGEIDSSNTTSVSTTDLSSLVTAAKGKGSALAAVSPNRVPPQSLSRFQFILIVLALCLAIFLVTLDNLIISTAIPTITNTFHSLDDVAWYGSSYLFTTCSFQLVFGKAYTFASPKYVFIFAIFLFEVGSAVCGAAPSSVALILGRTIAGIGSAGVFSGALIIVAGLVPLDKRPIYNAVLNSMYGIASVIGPLIGGVLTDNLSWRWCFYINLPLGGVSVVVIFFALRSKSSNTSSKSTLSWKQKLAYFDILGTSTLIPAVICLILALQWGGTTYSWSNFRIPLLFTFSFLLTALFAYIQLRQPGQNATLPPRILKQRTMAAASSFTVANAGPFFIFYIVNLDHLCLGVIVTSLASGAGTAWLGYYAPFFYASTLLQTIGAGLMTSWDVNTGTAVQVGYQIIYGFGVGFAMNLPFMCASTVLAEEDIAIGTAIITFFQTLSGAIFVAVGQNVYLNKLASALMRDLPNLDPNLVLHVGATDLKNVVPREDLTVVKQAYNDALTHMWYICVALACATVLGTVGIEWTNVKKKSDKADNILKAANDSETETKTPCEDIQAEEHDDNEEQGEEEQHRSTEEHEVSDEHRTGEILV
ncbi:hypothetical protein H2200_001220 [Cladophialophora chaetospira]|uniref:Major facilitator superfamily (MFS) profile domain-containing protein n=1 Tax=Cladophialophora chaetospira TaxID=386627 RepID=A0AA39CNV0_9EURO|nr:hypothetical protein H2200_001220 [Cladophialophora chaetospira]